MAEVFEKAVSAPGAGREICHRIGDMLRAGVDPAFVRWSCFEARMSKTNWQMVEANLGWVQAEEDTYLDELEESPIEAAP